VGGLGWRSSVGFGQDRRPAVAQSSRTSHYRPPRGTLGLVLVRS
jgi:hypothetical protein